MADFRDKQERSLIQFKPAKQIRIDKPMKMLPTKAAFLAAAEGDRLFADLDVQKLVKSLPFSKMSHLKVPDHRRQASQKAVPMIDHSMELPLAQVALLEPDDRTRSRYHRSVLCPFCSSEIEFADRIVQCPACGTVYHAECWSAASNVCSVLGCTGRGELPVTTAIPVYAENVRGE